MLISDGNTPISYEFDSIDAHIHTYKQISAICTFVIIVTKMSKLQNRINYVPQVFELLPFREYHCDFQCGKVFKNRLPYEMHLQRVHGVIAQENEFDAFKCPIENCEYAGSRLNLLRRHFQSHHMEKNYHCQNCDRKFLLDSQYNKHKCDVREYGCPRCFKIFKLLSLRNRHARICLKRSHVVPVQRVKNLMEIKLSHGMGLIQSSILNLLSKAHYFENIPR